MLEHPASGPSPADFFRMRIEAREVLSQGACASFLHRKFEGMNIRFDLSQIFVFLGFLRLFTVGFEATTLT